MRSTMACGPGEQSIVNLLVFASPPLSIPSDPVRPRDRGTAAHTAQGGTDGEGTTDHADALVRRPGRRGREALRRDVPQLAHPRYDPLRRGGREGVRPAEGVGHDRAVRA